MDNVTKSLFGSCDLAERKHRLRGERKPGGETNGGETPPRLTTQWPVLPISNTFRARVDSINVPKV